MAPIIVNCRRGCGRVELTPDLVQLDIHSDYTVLEWTCSQCGKAGSTTLGDGTDTGAADILARLIDANCRVLHDEPAEYGYHHS